MAMTRLRESCCMFRGLACGRRPERREAGSRRPDGFSSARGRVRRAIRRKARPGLRAAPPAHNRSEAGTERFVGEPDDFAQAAADAVADDGIADFLGDREADAGRLVGARGRIALARLEHEAVLMLAPPLGGGEEVGALLEAHDAGMRRCNVKTHAGVGVRGQGWAVFGTGHGEGRARRRRCVRRKGACGRARGGPRRPCGRRRWPCASGSRDGACARVWTVDRYASRVCSGLSRRVDKADAATIGKGSRWSFLPVVSGKKDPGAKPKIASGLIGAWPGKSQREAINLAPALHLCLLPSPSGAAKHRATVDGPVGPKHQAPVAQLDRALDYEFRGQRFESFRARHFPTY